jgi:acyl-CoA thioesterase-1
MIPKPRHGSTIYCAAGSRFNPVRILLLLLILDLALLAAPVAAETRGTPVILALGDSLTAGYGLAPEKSFPSQLEAALAKKGISVRVVNGGMSGDTSAGGLSRLDWLLAEKPDLVIVELGANDGLRGLDPAVTRGNLDRIATRIRDSGAHILLAGMRAPPNLGSEYGAAFAALYRDLAEKHGAAYYPFFLEGVAADPALNQEDGIHPTAEGIAVIVENILPVVAGALAEAQR